MANHPGRALAQNRPAQTPTTSGPATTRKRVVDMTTAEISAGLTSPPMTAPEIAANARVLLKALFFDPQLGSDDQRVMEGLYVENLRDLPAWAIRKAFAGIAGDTSWKRLPRPGEVRAEVLKVMEPLRLEAKTRARSALPPPPPEQDDPEKKARVDALVKGFANRAKSA